MATPNDEAVIDAETLFKRYAPMVAWFPCYSSIVAGMLMVAALGLGWTAGCWVERSPLKLNADTDKGSAIGSGGSDGASSSGGASGESGSGGASGESGSGGASGESGSGGASGESGSGGASSKGGAGGNPASDAGDADDAGGSIDSGAQDDAAIFPGSCNGFRPIGGACPSVCSSCEDGTCIFNCSIMSPAGGCTGAGTCPAGWACKIRCIGGGACTNGTLACSDGPCTAECYGIGACSGVTLACGDDACSTTCDSFGSPGMITLVPGNSCKTASSCP